MHFRYTTIYIHKHLLNSFIFHFGNCQLFQFSNLQPETSLHIKEETLLMDVFSEIIIHILFQHIFISKWLTSHQDTDNTPKPLVNQVKLNVLNV